MAETNTVARSLHDVGLAAWFGGSLMGATGLNGAASEVDDPRQRSRVANAGWDRWTPINLGSIAAHVAGGAMLVAANRGRLAAQRGVAGQSALKTGLTGAALVATAYSRVLGRKVKQSGDVPVEGGTAPSGSTPADVANAQKQLSTLQWVIPGLTGVLLVHNAYMGELQRPQAVVSGLLGRLTGRDGS
jgi:hypothetical protein